MTENNEDRARRVQTHVSRAIEDGFELIYERLDGLHKRDINDGDIIQAMHNLGEHDLLQSYAEWGQIELPDAEPTSGPVMDDVVPDPVDADSYRNYPEPKRLVDEFTAGELLDKVLRDLPFSYVIQTGGGTASMVFRKSPMDHPILAGPGSYHWNVPRLSMFNAGDFYYGPDTIGIDTDEPKHDGPGETMDPTWSLDQLAEKIKATYAQYNPEGAGK